MIIFILILGSSLVGVVVGVVVVVAVGGDGEILFRNANWCCLFEIH